MSTIAIFALRELPSIRPNRSNMNPRQMISSPKPATKAI
jgi:hypothetical protein